ncbi:MAG: hypothetical protein VKK42_23145 [Lyngbya sp.]|nr:hypothetical protein [Lyngbya sp.]
METLSRKTYKSIEKINSRSVATLEDYISSYNSGVQLAENAEGWDDYPIDFEHSSDTVLRLIAGGNTAWHLPFFYSDMTLALRSLLDEDDYSWAIAKFIAKFLLESLPEDSLDPDIQPFLESICNSTFSFNTRLLKCSWPAPAEFYRKTLQWSMIEWAENAEIERKAKKATQVELIVQGREDEWKPELLMELRGES